ncbi:MAG: Fic family protein [Candidatus Thermoplasmatota archaeon]|jgi:Fic family protein
MSTVKASPYRSVATCIFVVFTESQKRGGRTYHYRVRSVRNGDKVGKQRVYLGADLGKRQLAARERAADKELGLLSTLLTTDEKAFLNGVKRSFAAQPKATVENRYEAFVAQFTFDSNAIEGNTLTLDETSQLLFDGLVPAKTLREVNEALNHKGAFDHLLAWRGGLTKRFICDLHRLVVKETLRADLADQVGTYRTLQVYIRGVDWVPAAPAAVPKDMKALLEWLTKNRRKAHPLVLAAYFHAGFELIHPFVDGNGRVGRLLLNFILRNHGYPLLNIPRRRRRTYYAALKAAQVDGDLRPFLKFLLDLYRTANLRF